MKEQAAREYGDSPVPDEWKMRLYVTDWTPRCLNAYRNLKRICGERLDGTCQIEVIDLLKYPEMAGQDQIVAVPTFLIGDFSQEQYVLKGLGVENCPRKKTLTSRMDNGE